MLVYMKIFAGSASGFRDKPLGKPAFHSLEEVNPAGFTYGRM